MICVYRDRDQKKIHILLYHLWGYTNFFNVNTGIEEFLSE